MKCTVYVLFLIIVTTSSVFIVPIKAFGDFWITKAPIPVAMTVYGSVTLDGIIYAFGLNKNYGSVTYAYNPSTDSWIKKTPMPTARTNFGIAIYQSKIYVIGGGLLKGPGTFPTNVNEVYNPSTNSWTTKTPMTLNVTGICANEVNGKIYVISSNTQIYDPSTNTWAIAANRIPTPVNYYVSGVINGKIYIAGGSSSNEVSVNKLQIYDPKTDQWAAGPQLPTSVTQAGGAVTSGVYSSKNLYVIGGRTGGPALSTNQIYDVQTQNWTIGLQFPTNHDYITEGITATSLNDTIYVVGGNANANEGFYEITEQYIPLNYTGNIIAQTPTTTLTNAPSPTVPEFKGWIIPLLLLIVFSCLSTLLFKTNLEQIRKRNGQAHNVSANIWVFLIL